MTVKLVHTPLEQQHSLQNAIGGTVDLSVYKSMMGVLQYLRLTRPSITHAVNFISQFV